MLFHNIEISSWFWLYQLAFNIRIKLFLERDFANKLINNKFEFVVKKIQENQTRAEKSVQNFTSRTISNYRHVKHISPKSILNNIRFFLFKKKNIKLKKAPVTSIVKMLAIFKSSHKCLSVYWNGFSFAFDAFFILVSRFVCWFFF